MWRRYQPSRNKIARKRNKKRKGDRGPEKRRERGQDPEKKTEKGNDKERDKDRESKSIKSTISTIGKIMTEKEIDDLLNYYSFI